MAIPSPRIAPSVIPPFQAHLVVEAITVSTDLEQVTGCLSSLSLEAFDNEPEPQFWPEAQALLDLADAELPHDDIGSDGHCLCISDAFLEEWEYEQEHSAMALDDEWLSMTRLLAQ